MPLAPWVDAQYRKGRKPTKPPSQPKEEAMHPHVLAYNSSSVILENLGTSPLTSYITMFRSLFSYSPTK